ncbi:2-amino-4-hydroxy-6-hydroxymethyldihydropteridine diphosphokinase [Pedobacter sp. LMG 31464]|uniref:2-amino-4-hydroxy-6-hydroxymethyldihydropteridine pyrophosphokinase n=1 Tax=Pedobacter planticolens TaxID=2679964 RepID=A0A923IU08_9SPHI|nr:2-amino-4-hydroxy-6-hydroxymethyldihydropteridine diphosphokinase [Pedobacter planticolens]MBB2144361.1 2-amino-4-hydroxy-6-hydroxymethyldihydropteridine diphosphokinase [Pedobacter planticolens]
MHLDINRTYLLLGSNLGDRELYLDRAVQLISEKVGDVIIKSAVYETEPWGNANQPGFLNLALGVDTRLLPFELLETVLEIEIVLGRVRHEKWGSRLIDIDIIFYGDEIITVDDKLQIPHPEMQHRKFVLEPLAEIAPNLIHPILGKSITELLVTLTDTLSVSKR